MTSVYSSGGYGCGDVDGRGGEDHPVSGAMVRVLPQRGGFEAEQGDYERLVEAAVAAAEADDDEVDRRVPSNAEKLSGGSGGGLVVRDEWSDCATRALLSSWGERHLRLARGGLKLSDWAEVAKVVSSCSASPKTGVQCKNRVDTLKKKFKSERQKQLVSPWKSKWPFYAALERLLSMARDRDRDRDRDQEQQRGMFDELPGNHQGLEAEDAEFASSSSSWEERRKSKKVRLGPSRKRKLETEEEEDEESEAQQMKDLSDAIARFGEIYERFESSKRQQMADLERARLEVSRDLELHRMQLLMQAQMEVARLRHLQQHEEDEEEDEDASGSVLAGINLERSTTNF